MKAKANSVQNRSFEGIVSNGKVQLLGGACLPEKARVRVFLFDPQIRDLPRLASPRLVHPEEAADFRMEVEKL